MSKKINKKILIELRAVEISNLLCKVENNENNNIKKSQLQKKENFFLFANDLA